MYLVESKDKQNINNIILKTDSKTLFDFFIEYVDENILSLKVNIIDGSFFTLEIININNSEESIKIHVNKNKYYVEKLNIPFKLEKDETEKTHKIPKIIHQSYKEKVHKNMYNAISSWKLMNVNYEYKYWNDQDCYDLIKNNFDETILDAYNMLYAGAYKSDIFRLCMLYLYGGVWTDISSVCEEPIDKIIEKKNSLILTIDYPCQVTCGNIYQAFIVCEEKNNIIKYILDYTVERVINNEEFNKTYNYISKDTVAVTGPTIFAMALNQYLERGVNDFFKDESIKIGKKNIKLLAHKPLAILYKNNKIITTKYDLWWNDRTSRHYSQYFTNGYVYKKKLVDVVRNPEYDTIFQIWIQDKFVTENMYNNIQKNIELNDDMNFKFITNDIFLDMIKDDDEFPLLETVYKKLKPYAYKSDLIRYYLLYKYGGVYMDMDFMCINKISQLYSKNEDIIITRDINSSRIANALIITKKKEEFFKFLMDTIINNIINNKVFNNDLMITGPAIFGYCIAKYFNIKVPFRLGEININNVDNHEETNDIIKQPFQKIKMNLNILNRPSPKEIKEKIKEDETTHKTFANKKIKIIATSFNLPQPKGEWFKTSKDIKIVGNKLTCFCLNMKNKLIKNEIYFLSTDNITNDNGKLIQPNDRYFSQEEGSSYIYDNDNIYFNTKYDKFNDEKILLGGNDFAKMFADKDVFR